MAGKHVVGVAGAKPTFTWTGFAEVLSLFEREVRDVGRILVYPPRAARAWLRDPRKIVVGAHCLNPLVE